MVEYFIDFLGIFDDLYRDRMTLGTDESALTEFVLLVEILNWLSFVFYQTRLPIRSIPIKT